MRNKILNAFFGIFLLITLTIYVGAENLTENTTNIENYGDEDKNENISIDNFIDKTDTKILNDSLDEINSSGIEGEKIDEDNLVEESDTDFVNLYNISNNTNQNNSYPQESNKEFNDTNESLKQYNAPSEISSSGSETNNNVQYIDSSKLDLDNENEGSVNKTEIEERGISETEKNDVVYLYNSLGKKVVEIKECNKEETEGISWKENETNGLEKEVILSSQEHFDAPLTVYSYLSTESQKEDIKIYWEKEETLEITSKEEFSVEYYDENGNGLIDKVSWIVPHLSEQIFRIIIEMEQKYDSQEQLFLNVSGPPEQTTNPLTFNFNVNYSGNFSCKLILDGKEYDNLTSNQDYSINLPNGTYGWEAYCFDIINTADIIDANFGNFTVNEGFSVSLTGGNLSLTGGRLYFLDYLKNDLKYNGAANIHSEKPSSVKIEIKKDNLVHYTTKINENITDYFLILNKTILNQSGIYNLTVYFDAPSAKNSNSVLFSVASANLTFNSTQIQEGQTINIGASITSPLEIISYIILDYGNGTLSYQTNPTNIFSKNYLGRYVSDGQFTVKMNAIIGGNSFEIQKNGINVINIPSGEDEDSPSISLLNPDEDEIIEDSIVNFSYKASDNVKIQNCTFKLYGNCASMNYCSTSESNLIFPLNPQQEAIANNFSVKNNKEVEINLKDFEDGIYEWIVECYDNSSNYDWEIGFFEVKVNETSQVTSQDYDKKEEIDLLKEQADQFIMTNFDLDEKEILEDLKILNDTKYYKKRLLDIENFLKENYKYVSSPALRESKTKEYLEELEEIKNKIPKRIEIIGSEEYIKNSVDVDFEDIIEEYFQSTNTQISRASVKKLANVNRDLQNELSVSVKVKNVEIEYNNGTQEITLVKKEVTLNDKSYGNIIEYIPKDVSEDSEEIVFLNENKIIEENSLFELKYEDLEKEEIIYFFLSQVKLNDIKSTETLLFEDDLNNFDAGLTGFFVMEFITEDFTIYAILAFVLLIVLLFIIPFVIKKFKIIGWKREPNVVKVFNLIEEINKLLKEKEIENAREKYYKIKEIYPVLPKKTKPYFYQRIKEMLIRIDRKDIFNLVKEYQEAKRKWNKEDVMRLYEDIKKIYERLPEKDRKKVYGIINGY